MSKRKIVVNLDLDEKYIDEIKEVAPDWEIVSGKDTDELQEDLKDAEVILHWKKAIEQTVLEQNNEDRKSVV